MEEDDFINIRPPQAKSEDKSHRPRISSSKRDRQVFVSSGRRGDERSQNRQYFIWLLDIHIFIKNGTWTAQTFSDISDEFVTHFWLIEHWFLPCFELNVAWFCLETHFNFIRGKKNYKNTPQYSNEFFDQTFAFLCSKNNGEFKIFKLWRKILLTCCVTKV